MKLFQIIIYNLRPLAILSYLFVLGLIHLIALSLVNFFHFLLDHKMSVIDTWIFDRIYQLIFIEKVFACFVIHFFGNSLRSQSRFFGQRGFLSNEQFPHRETMIFTFVSVLLSIFLIGERIEETTLSQAILLFSRLSGFFR